MKNKRYVHEVKQLKSVHCLCSRGSAELFTLRISLPTAKLSQSIKQPASFTCRENGDNAKFISKL
jgi:hypothetical protein